MFNHITWGEWAAAEHHGQPERPDTCVGEAMPGERFTGNWWFKMRLYKWFSHTEQL